MAVKSNLTHKLDIPHEPGEWVEFRELGWRTIESARDARARTSLLSFRDLGPEFFAAITSRNEQQAEAAKATRPDVEVKTAETPQETYDMGILLRASIVAWSYHVPCNEANIDELDQRTASWAYQTILDIHFPNAEAQGKVSGTSSEL